MSELRCPGCGRPQPLWSPAWRCECGSPFTWVSDAVPGPPEPGWRYASTLPPVARRNRIDLGETLTPIVAGDFTYKLELLAPTGSFKDRGSRVVTGFLREIGATRAVLDSSGNAGASMAAHLAAAGIEATVFVPAHASPGKLAQIAAYGARLERVDGSRSEVSARAQAWAAHAGAPYASHLWSPFFVAGTRTFAFELHEQLGDAPRDIVVPVGSGSLLLGAHQGFAALRKAGLIGRPPRLFGVQTAACTPLADAFEPRRGAPSSGTSIAEGIMVAEPPREREVLAAVRESGGAFVRVEDWEIERAQAALAGHGLLVEPTAAAAEAGARRLLGSGTVAGGAATVVALTGSGLKTLS